MKKIIITSILCLVAFLSASAGGYKYYLNVKFTGAGAAYMSIPLSKMPILTYQHDAEQNTDVMLLSVSNVARPLQVFDLSNNYTMYYTKENTPASITSAIANSAFSKSGDIVTINALNANEMVSIYSANGTNVAEVSADANGVAVIDLSSMPKGVVIIKSKDASFKLAH